MGVFEWEPELETGVIVGDNLLAIQLEKEVYRWWEDHIMRTDMIIAAAVRAHAARGSGSVLEEITE